MDSNTLNNILLFSITIIGAGATALWLGFTIWTWQDMRARSRDPLAQIAATTLVFLLPAFGLVVYLLLRPRETLADAYERSLEEEALLKEIEDHHHCPGCGRHVHADWQVCPHCHTRLKKACVHCAKKLELAWNICPHCATPQVGYEDADQLEQAGGPPTGRSRSIMQQLQDDEQSPYEYRPSDNLEFVDD